MTHESPDVLTMPAPANVPNGIACPRCKGATWKVEETRQLPGCLLRIRTCCGCHMRIRSREKFEAVCRPAKSRRKPA